MPENHPMTLVRLGEILDAYGARAERWPEAERAAAFALLRASAEARRMHADAERLDAVLDSDVAPVPSSELLERIVSARPTVGSPDRRDRSGSGQATREAAHRSGAARRRSRRWRAVAAAIPIAAAAGLTLWLASTPPSVEAPAASPAVPAQIAAFEGHDVPTDAFLDVDELAVLDDLPAVGCDEPGDWGCPELDVPEERSTIEIERRTLT
jgi:hypothetical protein